MSQVLPADAPKTAPVRYRIQTIDLDKLMSDQAVSQRRQDYLRRSLCRMFPRKSFRMTPFGVASLLNVDDNADPLSGLLTLADVAASTDPDAELADRLERVELAADDQEDDDNALYYLGDDTARAK